jgi:hypothetical protein
LALWNSSWIICYQWLAGNFLGSDAPACREAIRARN